MALLEALEVLLGGLAITSPRAQGINGVHTHLLDKDERLADWSFHVIVEGSISYEDFGLYDDTLDVQMRLLGQDASVDRAACAKMLWAFRDKMSEAFGGTEARDTLGGLCTNWMLGDQQIAGVGNGSAEWASLVSTLTIVREVPYGE